MELIMKTGHLKWVADLFEIWWHLKWICLKTYKHKDQNWLDLCLQSVAFISHKSWCFHEWLEPSASTSAKSYLCVFTVQLCSVDLQTQQTFIRPIKVVLLVLASNHYLLHSIFILGCYVKHGTWPTPSTATVWKGSVASREWFQPGEWQPECLKPNESQTPTGILDPVMHLCTPELSLNRDLLGNPIGGHIKNSMP